MSISKNNTLCLKGIMAIMVLSHHLYQYSGLFHNSIIGALFQDFGYIAVAVFFFLSGYGLSFSYRNKGKKYLDSFLRNRVLVLYCYVLFLVLLYTGYNILLGNTVSWEIILQSLTYGETVIKLGWYLQTILILYITFFLIFSAKWNEKTKYVGMVIVVLIYCGLCILFQASITRYITIINFLIGMFSDYKCKRAETPPNLNVYFTFLLGTVLIFFARYIIDIPVLKYFLLMLLCVCFVISVIMTVQFIKIDYKITRLLGKISLEIYVIQGLFLSFFRSELFYIKNSYIYVSVVTIFTFVFAEILYVIFELIAKKICKN